MLSLRNVCKSYRSEGEPVRVLENVDLDIPPGRFTSIVGRSGSGKSTLLSVMASLLSPDSGSVRYLDEELTEMGPARIDRLRSREFSMVFQFHHLLPYLSARENVLLPYLGSLRPVSAECRKRADECLDKVGLGGMGNRLPSRLSGGEQQRLAIARALVTKPAILFADEPTGSLDHENGLAVIELLRGLTDEGLTVVMVTHERDYARMGDVVVTMQDGRVSRTHSALEFAADCAA